MKNELLEVNNLCVSFRMYDKATAMRELNVISDLSISLHPGEVLAVAGSSGSGKSLLAHAILGILPGNASVSGSMSFEGSELTPERQKELRGSRIALVPQSTAYLDPLMKVAAQVIGHEPDENRINAQKAIFSRLGLDEAAEKMYPFQLSGGMSRRVLLSTAVIGNASVIIADEPTPGMQLEQSLEAMKIFRELADEGKGVLLITHDIDLAFNFADKVAVFYAGTTVETADACDFLSDEDALRHPYSKALWQALPQNGFIPLEGTQPYSDRLPKGCLFAPRCSRKTKLCEEVRPEMKDVRGGKARCHYAA